jgi:hypothetical protein
MLSRSFAFFIVASAALIQVSPADVVLLDDTFNSEHGGIGQGEYNSFVNWNVRDGTVDLIDGKFLNSPSHSLIVDLDGTTNQAALLESRQAFALTPGLYRLQFDLAGTQRGQTDTATVALGSLFTESFTLPSDAPFETITRDIIVSSPSSAMLSFHNQGGDNIGLLLDNVQLVEIPEPGSISLMILVTASAWPRSRRASQCHSAYRRCRYTTRHR